MGGSQEEGLKPTGVVSTEPAGRVSSIAHTATARSMAANRSLRAVLRTALQRTHDQRTWMERKQRAGWVLFLLGVVEGSRADLSFIAGLLVDKFASHQPLYWQHQRIARASSD